MSAVSQALMVGHDPVTGTAMVVVVVLGIVVLVMPGLVVVVMCGLVVVVVVVGRGLDVVV